MERAAWTNERLDDLAESMRSGFARTDEEIRALRAEVHDEFATIRSEFGAEFRSLRTAIAAAGGGIIVALIGVIATLLAQGA